MCLRVAGVAAVGEGLGSTVAVALDPGVGRGAGDAEAVGEFGDGVEALGVEGDELGAFEHGIGGGEGHGRAPLVEGEPCKPSARSEV